MLQGSGVANALTRSARSRQPKVSRPPVLSVPPCEAVARKRLHPVTMASAARCTQFEFDNSRGQKLAGVEFQPADGTKPWASLVWHHGVCEHIGRYTPVFEHLAAAGVAVYSYDVHGHGRSEPLAPGDRGLINDYNNLVDDVYMFVGAVEQRTGGRLPSDSTFLGGQSMGGLVAALAALRCQERWAGLVVFSGAMGVVWTPVLRVQAALGGVIASLTPRAQLVPAVDPDNLHPDPEVVRSFRADPLVFQGNLRARTGNELLKAIKHLERHRGELLLPVYTVHGTKDAVTSMSAIEAFVDGVSSRDKTLNKVEGGYHEMLMGRERSRSADGIIAWMRAHVGGTPWQQQQQEESQQAMGGAAPPAAGVAEGPAGAKL